MQCENCGYIFFQPAKKCACCSAPYAPAQSAFDVGQETLFTIFEMAPGEGGIPSGMGMAEAGSGVEDFNFTDDFAASDTEYGVDENVLDLSDAEAEGFGTSVAAESMENFTFDDPTIEGTPSMEDAGPDDFELNLPDDLADTGNEVSTTTLEPEADDDANVDFTGGFDDEEVEGLGFGFDESPAEETPNAVAEEISMDTAPEIEAEISLEPELELADDEPSLELSDEPEFVLDDDEPSLELSEEPSLELVDDLELPEEPELIEAAVGESSELDDEAGMEFDLDSVDLDEPEEISYEVPEEAAETTDAEPQSDLDGLEMETPDEPEDEELTR